MIESIYKFSQIENLLSQFPVVLPNLLHPEEFRINKLLISFDNPQINRNPGIIGTEIEIAYKKPFTIPLLKFDIKDIVLFYSKRKNVSLLVFKGSTTIQRANFTITMALINSEWKITLERKGLRGDMTLFSLLNDLIPLPWLKNILEHSIIKRIPLYTPVFPDSIELLFSEDFTLKSIFFHSNGGLTEISGKSGDITLKGVLLNLKIDIINRIITGDTDMYHRGIYYGFPELKNPVKLTTYYNSGINELYWTFREIPLDQEFVTCRQEGDTTYYGINISNSLAEVIGEISFIKATSNGQSFSIWGNINISKCSIKEEGFNSIPLLGPILSFITKNTKTDGFPLSFTFSYSSYGKGIEYFTLDTPDKKPVKLALGGFISGNLSFSHIGLWRVGGVYLAEGTALLKAKVNLSPLPVSEILLDIQNGYFLYFGTLIPVHWDKLTFNYNGPERIVAEIKSRLITLDKKNRELFFDTISSLPALLEGESPELYQLKNIESVFHLDTLDLSWLTPLIDAGKIQTTFSPLSLNGGRLLRTLVSSGDSSNFTKLIEAILPEELKGSLIIEVFNNNISETDLSFGYNRERKCFWVSGESLLDYKLFSLFIRGKVLINKELKPGVELLFTLDIPYLLSNLNMTFYISGETKNLLGKCRISLANIINLDNVEAVLLESGIILKGSVSFLKTSFLNLSLSITESLISTNDFYIKGALTASGFVSLPTLCFELTKNSILIEGNGNLGIGPLSIVVDLRGVLEKDTISFMGKFSNENFKIKGSITLGKESMALSGKWLETYSYSARASHSGIEGWAEMFVKQSVDIPPISISGIEVGGFSCEFSFIGKAFFHYKLGVIIVNGSVKAGPFQFNIKIYLGLEEKLENLLDQLKKVVICNIIEELKADAGALFSKFFSSFMDAIGILNSSCQGVISLATDCIEALTDPTKVTNKLEQLGKSENASIAMTNGIDSMLTDFKQNSLKVNTEC